MRRIVEVYSTHDQSIREVFLRRFSRSLGGARSKTPFSASLASSFSSRSTVDNFANFDRTDSSFFISPSRSCALLSSREEDFSHYENEYSPKQTTCCFHVRIEKLIIRLWIRDQKEATLKFALPAKLINNLFIFILYISCIFASSNFP